MRSNRAPGAASALSSLEQNRAWAVQKQFRITSLTLADVLLQEKCKRDCLLMWVLTSNSFLYCVLPTDAIAVRSIGPYRPAFTPADTRKYPKSYVSVHFSLWARQAWQIHFLASQTQSMCINAHNSRGHVQRLRRRALRGADSEYKSGFKKKA